MASSVFFNAGSRDRSLNGPVNVKFQNMMAPSLLAARIVRKIGRRKHVLPAQLARRFWVLGFQRIREIDIATASLQVLFVPTLYAVKVQFERFRDRLRQHRDS